LRGGSLEADLLSRDFTINALALEYTRSGAPRLIDICGGERDLRQGVVRRVTAIGLAEDAIRILRAVRLAVQLGFRIDGATQTQMQRLAGTIRLNSPERVRDELWKMLASEDPAHAVEMLHDLGLLPHVLPEVGATVAVPQSYPHYQDVFHHTLATVRHVVALRRWLDGAGGALGAALPALEARLGPYRFKLRHLFDNILVTGRTRGDWLIWHALLHDIGKPITLRAEVKAAGEASQPESRHRFLGHEAVGAELVAARLNELRFSRHEVDLAAAVVHAHLRPHHLHTSFGDEPISRRALYRYFRDVGGAQFGHLAGIDTALLALADYQATYPASPPPRWAAYLAHIGQMIAFALDAPGGSPLPKPLVDGHELMRQLHLAPGPELGEILEQLREAQAAGEIATPAEALHLAARLLNRQHG
jgi:putative nucleotidyltransferase with HDIG domain